MAIIVESGVTTQDLGTLFVGQTLSNLASNELVADMFSLDGSEGFEVQSQFGGGFVAQGSGYVLQDGDRVRFTRSSGDKG